MSLKSSPHDHTTPPTGVGDITYIYEPFVIPSSSYKLLQPHYTAYRTSRTLLNYHGIRCVV